MVALLASWAFACVAFAQSPDRPDLVPPPLRPAPDAHDVVQDVHERMRQLLLQIERTLKSVDELFLGVHDPLDRVAKEASAPKSAAEVLLAARDRGRRALAEMDELLDIIHHEHPPGGT